MKWRFESHSDQFKKKKKKLVLPNRRRSNKQKKTRNHRFSAEIMALGPALRLVLELDLLSSGVLEVDIPRLVDLPQICPRSTSTSISTSTGRSAPLEVDLPVVDLHPL